MDPMYLAKLTSISSNMAVYKPTAAAIHKLYHTKYTKAGAKESVEEEAAILEELLALEAEAMFATVF